MSKKIKLKKLYEKWERAKQRIDEFEGDKILKSYAEGISIGIFTAIRILEEKED